MTKILALVDGSLYARSVCDHAAWIARRTGAGVDVLHVLGRRQTAAVSPNLSGSIALGARTALLEELSAHDEQTAKLAHKRGRAILDDAQAAIEAGGGVAVTTRLRLGDIVEEVTDGESDADIVVVGKRGEAADFAKLHLGSNLERVVRACTKPVFVASRAFKPIARVLIAYDGGPSSMRAVGHVARSALFKDLPCQLLMVGSDTTKNRLSLDNAAATLKASGYTVEAAIVQGHTESVIAQAVEANGVGLLVMGAYGHSRIRSLIIGSTTTAMVRECKIPVVLLR
jgi:nucleotide-binding universal stress UspA family protein